MSPTQTTARAPHTDSRAPQVLDCAAGLFCGKGYEATSVREIAQGAGMLPGSLYCHFANKEALLVAVYRRGVDQIIQAVQQALGRHQDPWHRLEAACVAHLEAVLRDDDYAQVVVRVRPSDAPAVAGELAALRDRYDALFTGLVAALPLARGTDRQALRLMLLGSLNWAQTWYRPTGRLKPGALARRFVALLRAAQENT